MAEKSETYSALPLGDVLEYQRANSHDTDVVLVCEGKDISAHKLILKTTSEYFRAMFRTPEWNEHNEGRIELPTVSAAEMDIILSYLYTGKFADVNNTSLLIDLLQSSHMMQVNSLFENCSEKLCKKLTSNSFIEILNLAQFYDNQNMKELVLLFMTKHFTAVTKSEEFLQLDASQVKTIIQRLNTRKSAMDNIVKGLIRWAEHKKDRQDTLLDVLTTLDLQEMSTDYLMELLSDRALVKKHNQVLTLLTSEATKRMFWPNRKRIICFGEKENKQVCAIYDIELKQWLESTQLPFHLEQHTRTVWLDGFVYLVGKGSALNFPQSSQIFKYNPLTNSHVDTNQLAIPVCLAGLGVLNKSIYVVNGVSEKNKPVKTVQCYNPATGNCELLADTNNAHGENDSSCFSNCLFVVGIYTDEAKVERYDPECDEWTEVTNIPGSLNCGSSAIIENKLYVRLAQTFVRNECLVYDLTAAAWSLKKFEEPSKDILKILSTSLERSHILLVFDVNNIFYFCDAESRKCLWKSKPNMDACFYRRICVT